MIPYGWNYANLSICYSSNWSNDTSSCIALAPAWVPFPPSTKSMSSLRAWMWHVEMKVMRLPLVHYCINFVTNVIDRMHAWILSTMSEMLAPPRETPKKLPPARLIFWTTCLESWMEETNQVSSLQHVYQCFENKFPDVSGVERILTGTSDKWSSKNPRKPCCIPTMFLTPYFSSVSTIYKSTKMKILLSKWFYWNFGSKQNKIDSSSNVPVEWHHWDQGRAHRMSQSQPLHTEARSIFVYVDQRGAPCKR